MAQNGKLPASKLASLPGGGSLRKDAALAYRALYNYCDRKLGVKLTHAGEGATYRELGRPGDYGRGGPFTQWYAWERYQRGGNLAAQPGRSNHGWGLAVDFDTIEVVREHGSRFGWKKTEAFNEPWHYCYVPGRYPMVKLYGEVRAGDIIRPGDRGTGVRAAKKLLKRHGFWPWPKFGLGTSRTFSRAVKRFQKSRGLPSDGIVGPKTWARLRARKESK
jgi:hypothetical protein